MMCDVMWCDVVMNSTAVCCCCCSSSVFVANIVMCLSLFCWIYHTVCMCVCIRVSSDGGSVDTEDEDNIWEEDEEEEVEAEKEKESVEERERRRQREAAVGTMRDVQREGERKGYMPMTTPARHPQHVTRWWDEQGGERGRDRGGSGGKEGREDEGREDKGALERDRAVNHSHTYTPVLRFASDNPSPVLWCGLCESLCGGRGKGVCVSESVKDKDKHTLMAKWMVLWRLKLFRYLLGGESVGSGND